MEFIIFMGGACFGLMVGGLFSRAHEDDFTVISEDAELVDLIRRDIKQRPYESIYEDDYKYTCPNCLHAFKKDERPDFCPDCGQRIAWGDRK